MAFVHAGGTVVEKKLDNDLIRVDTGCIVAFTGSIDYDIEMVSGLKSMFFGGEGLFLATLRGTGTVGVRMIDQSPRRALAVTSGETGIVQQLRSATLRSQARRLWSR